MQSLLGNKELAEKLTDGAQALQKGANSTVITQIPYSNVAQSGGGDVGTVIDIAMAGKGLIELAAKGSAKVAAKNVDEVSAPLIRQFDQFDEIAAKTKIGYAAYLGRAYERQRQSGRLSCAVRWD
jgi:hypothetical protein